MRQLIIIFCMLFCFFNRSYADNHVLNVYIWAGEVPDVVIKKFEQETGITVNFASYDSNEVLYAKLKASPNIGYDIIEPSSYYVDRMSSEGMLQQLDKSRLQNYHNLDPFFLHRSFDPKSQYSIPYIYGVTGIYVNRNYHDPKGIQKWQDFWSKQFYNEISLLNDPREVFSMALIALGYSPNDQNPQHIKEAFLYLNRLLPNIKLFNSDAITSIVTDGDATLGMIWNGDLYRAQKENPALTFVYPQDGFVIWVDCFVIPKNAPHLANAYKFLDFIMRPENAMQVTLTYGYGTANRAAHKQLPTSFQQNPLIFPPKSTLSRGYFQKNIPEKALELYAKYWEMLKVNA